MIKSVIDAFLFGMQVSHPIPEPSLPLVQLGLHIPGGLVAGDDHPQQRQDAGDESHDDCFHSVISFLIFFGGLG